MIYARRKHLFIPFLFFLFITSIVQNKSYAERMVLPMVGVSAGYPSGYSLVLDTWIFYRNKWRSPAIPLVLRVGINGISSGIGHYFPIRTHFTGLHGLSLDCSIFYSWRKKYVWPRLDKKQLFVGPQVTYHIKALNFSIGAGFHTWGNSDQTYIITASIGANFIGGIVDVLGGI